MPCPRRASALRGARRSRFISRQRARASCRFRCEVLTAQRHEEVTMAPQLVYEAERLSAAELRDAWPLLLPADRLEGFRSLDPAVTDDFFLSLTTPEQAGFLMLLPEGERRLWLRLLPPDDAADVIQALPPHERDAML